MLTRREIIRSSVAATALAAAPSVAIRAAQAANTWFDLADPEDVIAAYARMRGHLNGDLGLWWYRGTCFGKRPDDVAEALLTIEGYGANRLIRRADGRFDQHLAEAGYFKDRGTNEIIDTWVNPLNGESCTVGHYKSEQRIVVGPDGVSGDEDSRVPIVFTGTVEAQSHSGQVWTTENMVAKVPNMGPESDNPAANAGPVITIASLAAFSGRVADLQNRDLTHMPATLHFQNLAPWLPWMKMAAEPGLTTWQLMGVKIPSSDDIPAPLKARLEADYPGWLKDPGI